MSSQRTTHSAGHVSSKRTSRGQNSAVSVTASSTGWGSKATHGSGGSGGNQQSPYRVQHDRAVIRARLLFLGVLVCIAAAFATGFYFVFRHSETTVAEIQYKSIADRALDTASEIHKRKRLGTVSMASIAANQNPNAETWPFVVIGGYEDQATKLIETSSGREIGFAPMVRPDERVEFEEFIYNFYQHEREPLPFSNTTGVAPFGPGLWQPAMNGTKIPVDVSGDTPYPSPNKVYFPLIHHNAGDHPVLLNNLRFEPTRGLAIDEMLECSKERAALYRESNVAPWEQELKQCGLITDMLILTSQGFEPGPGALIMQPVYPRNNPTAMTGVIASSIVWDEILVKVFPDQVSGIDCVLETETQVYTYSINQGKASLRGEGNLHIGETLKEQIQLTANNQYSDFSASYTLTIYPTDEFFESYRTGNPAAAAAGAALCIGLTALLFFLYDFYVHKEFNSKVELLQAKRQYVRFVSHEVRTPLNSVCMGLALMQEEMGAALGIKSPDDTSGNKIRGTHKIDRENATGWFDLAHEIMVNAQSSVDVLNDLLNYDKIEGGGMSLEYTVINIWNLIETTVAEFKLPAAAKQINFSLCFPTSSGKSESSKEEGHVAACADIENGLGKSSEFGTMVGSLSQDVLDCKVVGDAVRITQVLRNLLSNALKFTKDGGKMSVSASWKRVHQTKATFKQSFDLKNQDEPIHVPLCGFLEVAVTDSGAGMSAKQLKELFGDGVQFNVNELQSGQGSGLGLYIAKGIAEQLGGSLSADSEGLGKGTTFTLTLPLFHIPDSENAKMVKRVGSIEKEMYTHQETSDTTTTKESPSPAADVQTYLHILVVDDAPTNRKLLKRLLLNRGHTVEEAENGRQAVDMVVQAQAKGITYDSILLDYEMPIMNGPDACREMRNRGCDSFIVGVTGNVMTQDVDHFKECGANGVLPKPFRLKEMDQLWLEYGVTGSVVLAGSQ